MVLEQIKEQPTEWISCGIMDLICSSIGFIFLYSEIKQRFYGDIPFTTRWSKYLSLSCITSGFLLGVFGVFMQIPGLCIFSRFAKRICTLIQVESIGLYQLCRLYHCFANEKIHSTNYGYPKWIFIVMFTLPGLMVIMYMSAVLFGDDYWVFYTKCGYSESWEYYYYYQSQRKISFNEKTASLLFYSSVIVGLIWDGLTLFLYIFKIKQLNIYQDRGKIVYKKIISILHKLATLTLLYQFAVLFIFLIQTTLHGILTRESLYYRISSGFIGTFSSLPFTMSMYLMLDHNKKSYLRFLRCIYHCKLYIICCFCRNIVTEQIDYDIKDLNVSDSPTNSTNDATTKTQDLFEEVGGINDTQTNHKVGRNTATMGGVNISDIQRFESDPNTSPTFKQDGHTEISMHIVRQISEPNATNTGTKTEDLYPNRFRGTGNSNTL